LRGCCCIDQWKNTLRMLVVSFCCSGFLG
jgi:hypothetical protein